MRRTSIYVAVILLAGVMGVCQASASEPSGLRGRVWIQPAFGTATGDDMVSSDIPATVSMTGIPIIGSVGVTLPLTGRVELEDPVGITFGGEVIWGRVGLEVTGAYVRKAAVASGGLKVRGGLLTEQQCDLLEAFGISVPDLMFTEQDIENFAVTAGVNYHFIDNDRWDVWAGPMVVWSAWGEYDLADARLELEASLESVLQGDVGEFELSNSAALAPEDALTFGASLGGSYRFAGDWSILGNVRYFHGDEIELPGSTGSYGAVSFSVGVAVGIGG